MDIIGAGSSAGSSDVGSFSPYEANLAPTAAFKLISTAIEVAASSEPNVKAKAFMFVFFVWSVLDIYRKVNATAGIGSRSKEWFEKQRTLPTYANLPPRLPDLLDLYMTHLTSQCDSSVQGTSMSRPKRNVTTWYPANDTQTLLMVYPVRPGSSANRRLPMVSTSGIRTDW